MKKTKYFGCIAALSMTLYASAQADWSTGGNFLNGGEWFGADGSSTVPLQIRHDANQPIEWYTNAVQRMLLNPDVNSAMGPGGAFPGIQRDGFLLLSGQPDAFTNAASRAPFTRLHLIDDATGSLNPVVYAQEHGFRPWQRNGITFTGNSDQSYIGHKYDANDNTDFVIQWSDNPNSSPWGTDRMKFVFTTQFNGGASRGAATLAGLEAMRFWPRNNSEVNVGIGDFAPPIIGDPTERLDILDGRVRIRQLPDDPEHDGEYGVMVVDFVNAPNGERGVVKWVDPNNFPGAGDCDWEITTNTDVVTAYDPAPTQDCPGEVSLVGIGLDLPNAKLHVVKVTSIDPFEDRAAIFHNRTPANFSIGADGLADSENPSINVGVRGTATNSPRLYGVWGIAGNGSGGGIGVRGDASNCVVNTGVEGYGNGGTTATGVFAYAEGASVANFGVSVTALGGTQTRGVTASASGGSSSNVGVYGQAPSGVNDWSIWSQGTPFSTAGAFWTPSDEMLKQNIEDFSGGLDLVMQMQPKSYTYNIDAYDFMGLALGPQIGLISQEVESVVPSLVRDVHRPADIDSAGVEISPSLDFKAMQYEGIIPILLSAIKEQQAIVLGMQSDMAQLQEQVAACCALPSDDSDARSIGTGEDLDLAPKADRLLNIQPNPFIDHTTISYTLERAGRAMLIVNSGDGKQLQVLDQADKSEGEYRLEWSTGHLSPGVYYVTLLLDGEPLVKRAVKVR